jgi:hypothetical protein
VTNRGWVTVDSLKRIKAGGPWDNGPSIMSWCCKSRDVTTPKVLVIEERIRAFLLRPTLRMDWFVRILYAVVVLVAVLGLSMRIFK